MEELRPKPRAEYLEASARNEESGDGSWSCGITREHYRAGAFHIGHISCTLNPSDMLTKILSGERINVLRQQLRLSRDSTHLIIKVCDYIYYRFK